mgnify:CR=1 FL=1
MSTPPLPGTMALRRDECPHPVAETMNSSSATMLALVDGKNTAEPCETHRGEQHIGAEVGGREREHISSTTTEVDDVEEGEGPRRHDDTSTGGVFYSII